MTVWRGGAGPTHPGRVKARSKRAWIAAVVVAEPDGLCRDWEWPAGGNGYPYFNGVKVSHLVLEASGVPRPAAPSNFSLHSCDRPICCAPWHLRWGSHTENCLDMQHRGRTTAGERNSRHKLTEAEVRSIRAATGSQSEIAARFGVDQSTVSLIRRWRTWRHLARD